ncbi:hypothetical protein C5E16_11100 [Clavibacter michiganensis]|uniref:DUF8175 domain-containing protein n=1 Tax=Clavibacter michiganensis TaxID=28447 RepID=A0A2S5VSC8_9MICO|nr:hypothetical protein [Clavibacter michiganensis]PPF66654.1 hypothetical protein C5E16_11100 [Clavibacter michiganensis]
MTDHDDDSPFKKKGFIFGAVLCVALFLAATVIGLTSSRGGGDEEATPAATSSPSATPQVAASDKSVCGLPGYEETGTLTTAPAASWTFVGTMAAPGSKQAGPGTIGSDGVRSCYAHTVDGAVLAVANIWAMGSDARLSKLALDEMTAPGPGRDAAIAANIPQSNTGLSVQIVGVKVLSYDGRDATIDVAFRTSTGQLYSFPAPVTWVDGDWKSVLTDDGQPPLRPTALQSLGGYIPWEAAQ